LLRFVPLRYTDPSGHCADDDDACWEYLQEDFCDDGLCEGINGWRDWIIAGDIHDSIWTEAELRAVRNGLLAVRDTLTGLGLNWTEEIGEGLRFRKSEQIPGLGRYENNEILLRNFYAGSNEFGLNEADNAFRIVIHEIGHAVDETNGFLRNTLPGTFTYRRDPNGDFYDFSWRTTDGYYYRDYGRDQRDEGYADAFASLVWTTAHQNGTVAVPREYVGNPQSQLTVDWASMHSYVEDSLR